MIHNLQSRRVASRRLDACNAKISNALERMAAGAALRVQFTRFGPVWTVDGGLVLDDATARSVIKHPAVIDCGDALLAGVASQTYRFVH
jgi:hypothetical protein